MLEHLEGYRGSAPVRIGNGAAEQLQLDIYGELMDSVYLFNKYGRPIYHDGWEALQRIVDWVCDNWDQPDEGIWEVRGGQQNFVYSRLMCWVAIERAIRDRTAAWPSGRSRALARRRATRSTPRSWSAAGTRSAGVRPALRDATTSTPRVLLMPLVKFIAPTDPRWLSTLDAISRRARLGLPRLPLQRRAPRRTACEARRARSRSAPSGTSRRSRAPAVSTRRGSPSRRC